MKPVVAILLALVAAAVCAAEVEPIAEHFAADTYATTGTRSLKCWWCGKFSHNYYSPSSPAPPPSPTPPPSPPVTSPRPGLWGLKQDLHEALRCQMVYQHQYGGDPNNLKAALGPACQEATLNPIQCCTDSVKLLNSPDLYGCICNHYVYSQLCGQLNVAGQNCQTLLPTLKSCGLQCPQ